MKLFTTAALLATAGKANANFLRHLQDCPTGEAGIPCTADFNPVQCGADNCEYSNLCGGTAAGFEETECCPVPGEEVMCTMDFAPVQCGTNNCEYSNICGATAARFEETDCCPISGENVPCTADFAPVTCGENNCQYSNLCNAEAARFTDTDCCPAPLEDIACTADFVPVTCGDNNCEYSNLCLATASGFEEDNCTPVDEAVTLPVESECPVGDAATPCTLDLNPVQCGADSCQYSNLCGGTAAGFEEADCCPVALEEVMCTMDFAPVQCGTNNCEYSNLCNAQAARFAEADCAPVDEAVTLPEETKCPEPAGDIMCTMDFNPVLCGDDNCEYSNLCGGTAAGFEESDCSPKNPVDSECPEPAGDVMCTMDFNPVLCGDDNCEYSNLCGGTAAGFEESECTPKNPVDTECPVAGEGVACTDDFAPVQCGDNNCEYSNQCNADAAGFTEADCMAPPEVATFESSPGEETDSTAAPSEDAAASTRAVAASVGSLALAAFAAFMV